MKTTPHYSTPPSNQVLSHTIQPRKSKLSKLLNLMPWVKRQSPPDLDEVFNDLKRKFGSRSSKNNKPRLTGDSPPPQGDPSFEYSFNLRHLNWVFALAFLVWLASGFYIVNPAERGVILRFGDFTKTTTPGPNWHLPFPIETVEVVNVDQIRNAEIGYRSGTSLNRSSNVGAESLMLTEDENIVDVKLAVQYRIQSAEDYLFNVRNPDSTLMEATESAIREVVGKSSLNFVLTNGRDSVAQLTQQLTQEILDKYETGLVITSLNLQDVQPPEFVQDAFNDAVRAREDRQRLINEAEAYQNNVIPRARGQAARVFEEAEAYKAQITAVAQGRADRFLSVYNSYQQYPEVTEKRLFLETIEEVLANTPKVILDGAGAQAINLIPTGNLAAPSLLGAGLGFGQSHDGSGFNNSSPTTNNQLNATANGQNSSNAVQSRNSSIPNQGADRLNRAIERFTRR